jgi:hypothetical protein
MTTQSMAAGIALCSIMFALMLAGVYRAHLELERDRLEREEKERRRASRRIFLA